MSKVLLFALVGLMAVTLITARSTDKQSVCTVGRHGDPCVSVSQCCPGLRCNSYAGRCQVIITAEELMAQREKIFSKNKNKNKSSAPGA
ncbi:omega-conotoxin-like protein 1 [Diachasma alloeum]|uniref:omega-conotoxin-like protein 1 n=1 Tax=Diachasma alloeum TaxID=454923 RepID=UPI00073836FF|nr:omega-conotoxin-like protein 1 [Diachasma alloeum]